VPEFPLVLSESLNVVSKTKDAKAILEKCGASQDVDKVKDTRKVRCGAGKTRNRRFVARKGPLVVYDVSEGLVSGFRNLPGVDLANVENLSLLDLAPGGHLGRFCIWTQAAFEKLDSLFGTYEEAAQDKAGFSLPRSSMTNADLARIINSDEVQSVLNPSKAGCDITIPKKTNPLRNRAARVALNPQYAAVQKRAAAAKAKSSADRKKAIDNKRKERSAFAARKKDTYNKMVAEGDVNVW